MALTRSFSHFRTFDLGAANRFTDLWESSEIFKFDIRLYRFKHSVGSADSMEFKWIPART